MSEAISVIRAASEEEGPTGREARLLMDRLSVDHNLAAPSGLARSQRRWHQRHATALGLVFAFIAGLIAGGLIF